MEKHTIGEIEIYTFGKLSEYAEIKHFITTRKGGVSLPPYDTLNIGYGTDDFSINVLENRHRMAAAFDIPLDYFVVANQVHGTNIEIVSKQHSGRGALYRDNSLKSTDAIITNQPEVCLFIMNADCVPVLFFDPVIKVIGAAHAGWRGTLNKIAALTVHKMHRHFGCKYSNIIVGIGPSIGPCCYEVGNEMIENVINSFGKPDNFIHYIGKGTKPVLDLWYTNKYQLIEIGITEENIEISNLCTYCNQQEFYSSRAAKGITGRFGAGIMLV